MRNLLMPGCPLLLSILVAAAALVACDDTETSANGPTSPTASPEAVIAHLRTADESRNFGSMLEVMVPDYRASFVWSAWFGAAYRAIGAEADTVAAYEAINARYGLDPEFLSKTSGEPLGRDGLARLADEAFAEVDLAALLTDLLDFTSDGTRFFGPESEGSEVTVEGARAVASVGGSKLALRRLDDGRWYWFPQGSEDE